jgi:hypothetical protein
LINLGFVDIFLVLILVIALIYSLKRRYMLPFYVILTIVVLIELERLAPGLMTTVGSAIHQIDAINEQLPHVQISPIVTIR